MDALFWNEMKKEKNLAQEFISSHQGKSIYLYGAGVSANVAVEFAYKHNIQILGIVDSYKEGMFTAPYSPIPIVSLETFLKQKHERSPEFLISAVSFGKEIVEILAKHFPRENIHYFVIDIYTAFIPDIDAYRHYLESHSQMFQQLSESLADEDSRKTLDGVLKGRMTAKMDYFTECYVPDQYYPKDIVHFKNGEVMVELGGNNGETLEEFLKLCPDYCSVYCFEPDDICFSHLEKIQKIHHDIHIVHKGAWSNSGTLAFLSDGGAGRAHLIVDADELPSCAFQIEVVAVDDVIKEKITYMKMDIEGAELEALKGAKEQIKKNKPTLAVCVYHRAEDLLEIPAYLKSLVPEYRFYLRHHSEWASETVLYAMI